MTMKYAFITRAGELSYSREFAYTPPTLSPTKGRWIPDNPPTINSSTHTYHVLSPIVDDAIEVPYIVETKPVGDVIGYKMLDFEDERTLMQALPIIIDGVAFPANIVIRELISSIAALVSQGDPIPNMTIQTVEGQQVRLTEPILNQLKRQMDLQVITGWTQYNDLISRLEDPNLTAEDVLALRW